VEVVAICGRDVDVVSRVAARLDVEIASTDWLATLADIQPDIVAIATPAALRLPVIEAAIAHGSHMFCDKPLATTASGAAAIFHLVDHSGLKHGFAATRRYDPSVAWISELIAQGTIGRVTEVLYQTPTCIAPVIPWSWSLVQGLGGGLLNNHFTHLLSILERVLSQPVVWATGDAEFSISRAPYVSGIHDFRDLVAKIDSFSPEELESAQWLDCDADTSYRADLKFGKDQIPVKVMTGQEGQPSLRITGERGTLLARGELSFQVSLIDGSDMPVPDRLLLPPVGGGIEDRYAALARDFVADISGLPHEPYLTFRDGWRYQEVIEAIRSGTEWPNSA
jgi:predicted dehydrogenase